LTRKVRAWLLEESVMSDCGYPRLLADIGGTHARFASQLGAGEPLSHVARYACADFETLWDAICHHLWREGLPRPSCCAIGIATAITGDQVRMTNHHWNFSINALRSALGVRRLVVLNDFSALALALPALQAHDWRQVGGGEAVPGAPVGLVGPGTGLGVSGLVPQMSGGLAGAAMVPIAGEGGHVTLSSSEPEEAAVLAVLQRRFGHVSAEQALSGPGLENLYRALGEVRGDPHASASAAQITAAALGGDDGLAGAALALFCALLGDVAGNLALTLGARGGLYVGGGIVPRLGDWFDRSAFRERFESKGRFRGYLSAIPTLVLQSSDQAALMGAARALDSAARAA
jgi:glucokinase